MPKARRDLVASLTRALAAEGVEYTVVKESGSPTAVDFTLVGTSDLDLRALVIDHRLVAFCVTPEFTVPRHHLEAAIFWSLEKNASLVVGVVELDPEDGEILFRHTVDCEAVPDVALEAHLTAGWTLAASVWMGTAPSLLPVLAGARDCAEDADEDEGPESAVAVESVVALLQKAAEEQFGEELAFACEGAFQNLAATYVERIEDAVDGEVEVAVSAEGDDDEAMLILNAPGVPSLTYRFSPNALRERAEQDAEGLVLYHYADAARARQILAKGFRDEALQIGTGFGLTEDGIPIQDDEVENVRGVFVTNGPTARDDRPGRLTLLTISWSADAPPLYDFERMHTGYTEEEAFPILDSVRRWYVPAQVLNEAVREGLAEIKAA